MNAPIHTWFGLSYANYLVLPRTVLQSMPQDWQERFVALLGEVNAACDAAGVVLPRYHVQPVDRTGRYVKERLPHYRHAPNILVR
jgi:hypothetical protein